MNKNYTTNQVFKTAILIICFFVSNFKLFSQDDLGRIQKVVASDRTANETFGFSVSIYQNYAVVGCPYTGTDENGTNSITAAGAIYILEKNSNGEWIEVKKIVAPNRETYNLFGSDVAIYDNNIIVGSPGDDYDSNNSNFLSDAGSAFIYERDNLGNWNLQQKICPTIRASNDYFGRSVSIDFNRLVVGAPYNQTDLSNANPLYAAGAVFAFEKTMGGTWIQFQKIVEQNRQANNQFGISLDQSYDMIVVGSPFNSTDATNSNFIAEAGAAYTYMWPAGPISYFSKIVASDRKTGAKFGFSVAINSGMLAIGAPYETSDAANLNPITGAGAVYSYNFMVTPSPAFYFDTKMVAPDRSTFTMLGRDVDVYGYHIIAGSSNSYDLNNDNFVQEAGAAYVFKKVITFDFNKKLVARNRAIVDYFGSSVAISSNSDGLVSLVNCNYDDEDENESNVMSETGSVYFYGTCVSSTSSITESACNRFEYYGSTYSNSGTYTDTIPNAIGCDSIVTINLTIIPLDTTLSYTNGTLTSNASNATFQWVNCQTGLDVPGATNQSFTPSVNGMYKVRITSNTNGCEVESACAVINNAGINENENLLFTYYPNPATNQITIEGKEKIKRIRIYQLTGGLIQELEIESIEKITLDVSNLIKGIYFFQVETSNSEIETFKISIQ